MYCSENWGKKIHDLSNIILELQNKTAEIYMNEQEIWESVWRLMNAPYVYLYPMSMTYPSYDET